MKSRHQQSVFAVAAAAALGIVLCTTVYAQSGPTTEVDPGSVDPAVAALVPESFKAKGALAIALSASHPPNAYFNDENKLVGWEVELGRALTARMGLKADFQKVQFAQILTGLQSGRYDLGLSGISDNKKREEVVTFVDYFTAGTSLVVQAGNPKQLKSIADLCGTTVAIETGTSQVGFAQGQSDKCVAAGKKPIEVKTFPDETQVQLQIRTGRADAGLNDFPVAAYIALLSEGKLEAVRGDEEFSAPYGLAIAKENEALVKAVQAALQKVIADGTYDKILKEWSLEDGALKTGAINGASK